MSNIEDNIKSEMASNEEKGMLDSSVQIKISNDSNDKPGNKEEDALAIRKQLEVFKKTVELIGDELEKSGNLKRVKKNEKIPILNPGIAKSKTSVLRRVIRIPKKSYLKKLQDMQSSEKTTEELPNSEEKEELSDK